MATERNATFLRACNCPFHPKPCSPGSQLLYSKKLMPTLSWSPQSVTPLFAILRAISVHNTGISLFLDTMSVFFVNTPVVGGAAQHRHATALVTSSIQIPHHACFKSNTIPKQLQGRSGRFLAGARLHTSAVHSGRPDRGSLRCQAAAEKETVAVTGDELCLTIQYINFCHLVSASTH